MFNYPVRELTTVKVRSKTPMSKMHTIRAGERDVAGSGHITYSYVRQTGLCVYEIDDPALR